MSLTLKMGNVNRISIPLAPGYVVYNLFKKKKLKLFLEQLHCPSDVWRKLQASL